MTIAQLAKENQELREQIKHLTDLARNINLPVQMATLKFKIKKLYFLLNPKDSFSLFDERDPEKTLDSIFLLAKYLLFDNESCQRENALLRSIIRDLKEECE